MQKKCFKCGEVKNLSEFYKHKMMADGHLNKCKQCNKKDVIENRKKNVDYYREYDKKRYKQDPKVKQRIERYLSTPMGIKKASEAKSRWIAKNPVRKAAQTILGNAVKDGKIAKPGFCESCGKSGRILGHHCDYAMPLDVMWLCPKCHKDWHSEHGEAANG